MSDRVINSIFALLGALTIGLMVYHMREWRMSQARVEVLMSKGCDITPKEKIELSELLDSLKINKHGMRR